MFTYIRNRRFHVRFFKQDPKLAKAKEQLNQKIQKLLTMINEEYQTTNEEGEIVKTSSIQATK